MKSAAAFKFIGKLSTDVMRCTMNINSGNVVCACIDAGIALIDMTSSIISYSSECKRTSILRHQIYESKALLDLTVEQHRRAAELEIQNKNQLLLSGLQKLKLELSKEYEAICLNIESQKNQLIQSIEFERKRNQIVDNVRLMIKDTLTISADTLEILNKDHNRNKFHIASLEEQIRLSTAQYSKMIKLCC
ncbi:hypothetical protein ACPUYX_11195 [Desulfosporosinus sp. SYSU MS00001]|uniref:hypothetical protein n=1 Tax=Desulfosporosinus sp. SYSU MS00001 TaxID=3416284 RepID=UPI003CEF6729